MGSGGEVEGMGLGVMATLPLQLTPAIADFTTPGESQFVWPFPVPL